MDVRTLIPDDDDDDDDDFDDDDDDDDNCDDLTCMGEDVSVPQP